MTKSIRQEIFYPHPPTAVWEYLTKADLISKWLMPNDFQPITGHDFRFTTKPIPSLDLDGIFYCKVLEIVPLKKLSYSWKGGPGDGKFSFDTIAVWTLEEKDGGTMLYLEHNGFKDPENLALFNGMTKGWAENMQKVANLLKAINP
jgi:uncharacterized protein YndB with AHSA1/START domain